jgi:catechol 2,3-dioxygenase-like lactoylglutathione lyase family enzyme
MIQKLSHATLFVEDQDAAKDFYVNKLGFDVRMDETMENGFRWLTVAPKGQPELQIVLMKAAVNPFFLDEESVSALQLLLRKGVLGAGVFQTGDCLKTYEELSAKGVEFKSAPQERFYGTEAVFKDNCGNWFSLTEPKSPHQ